MVRTKNVWWVLCLALVGCNESHDEGGDASAQDASAQDASAQDASAHDASAHDASAQDAGSADAGSRDAGSRDAGGDAASSDGGGLHWYQTCGAPLCGPSFDGPTGQPLCTTEKVGDACSSAGKMCDPSLGCAVNLVCAASDPKHGLGGCPISRARYKRDIRYLDESDLSEVAARLLRTPLAEWHYKDDVSRAPQMGFIIEDVEPSPSVVGDQVNLYGYTSMAVAALKVQSEQLRAMSDELSALRARLQQIEQRCVTPPSLREPPPRRSAPARALKERRNGGAGVPDRS